MRQLISTHVRGSLSSAETEVVCWDPLWRLGVEEIDATVGATWKSLPSLSGKCLLQARPITMENMLSLQTLLSMLSKVEQGHL